MALDPHSVKRFIDIDSADERLIEKFSHDYPDLRAMMVHRTMDLRAQEVTFKVTIFLPDEEVVVHEATVPMYQVSPINQEPD